VPVIHFLEFGSKYSKDASKTKKKKKHEVAPSQELFNCLVAAFQDVLRQKLLPEFLASFAISVDLMWNGYPDSCYIDGIFCGFSQAIQERCGMLL